MDRSELHELYTLYKEIIRVVDYLYIPSAGKGSRPKKIMGELKSREINLGMKLSAFGGLLTDMANKGLLVKEGRHYRPPNPGTEVRLPGRDEEYDEYELTLYMSMQKDGPRYRVWLVGRYKPAVEKSDTRTIYREGETIEEAMEKVREAAMSRMREQFIFPG